MWKRPRRQKKHAPQAVWKQPRTRHGEALGSLLGTQAEQALVPNADLVLRRVPAGMGDEVALFAGDVMGTAFDAVDDANVRPGDTVAVHRPRPRRPLRGPGRAAFGAAEVIGIDTVAERLELARSFGARSVHLHDGDPRAAVREHTGGRGADHRIDAVGSPEALDLAIRLARKGGSVEGSGSTRSAWRCTWASRGSSRSRSAAARRT